MEAKVINKYSKKTYSQLHATAKKWFHKFIRLRDTDENGFGRCISSSQTLKYGTELAQAGHYLSAGKYKSLEFNEDNVHLQGKSDNYFNHGNESAYRINLVKKIGVKRVEDLEMNALISKRSIHKQNRYEMVEVIEIYKVKVKELAKTKMFEVK